MAPIRLLLLLGVTIVFGSAALASPFVSPDTTSSKVADLIVQAGFKCDLVNGKLECGTKGNSAENDGGKSKGKHDDDDDDNDHGKSKKHKGDDSGLTECSILQPGEGGGCTTGLKWTCEKLKSGKKCCGCVPDKTSGGGQAQPAPPVLKVFECQADVLPATVQHSTYGGIQVSSEEEARTKFLANVAANKWTLNGPVVCKQTGP